MLEDEPGDAVTRGPVRQRVTGEPACILELVGVDANVTTGVGGHEADHELAGKRPVLAAHVGDVGHVDPDLLLDLARHASLERPVSYTHLRAHETPEHLVCRLLLEKK